MTPGHRSRRGAGDHLASSPAVTTHRTRTAFLTTVAAAVLVLAPACSSDEGAAADATAPAASTSPTPDVQVTEPGLYLLELSTGEIEPLPGVPAEALALAPAVSPDGTRIAFDAE